MQSFATFTGCAIRLTESNIDTDVIIPILALVGTGRGGLGPHAFAHRRRLPGGSGDPAFPLNQPPDRGSPILLAAENFGCGSSREGAEWALMALGIRCIVAPSFGDIFFGNCLPNEAVRRLAEQMRASPGNARTTVDLVRRRVIGPDGEAHPFQLDAHKRAALLEGLDDVAPTLRQGPKIAAWTANHRQRTPWA